MKANAKDSGNGGGSGTAIARTGGHSFLATEDDLAGLEAEVKQHEGQGTSGAREDNLIPFLAILQDGSPQVKKREPTYIEGAEPGMILRTDIRKLYRSLVFQPCHFSKRWNEWVPRNSGGGGGKGFIQTFDEKPANAKNRIINGKEDPNAFFNPDNGNDYVETRYHFGNILDDDGTVAPAVIGMTSTQHTVSRGWMALMRSFRVGGVVAPSFFRAYELSTVEKSNAQGNWFVYSVRDLGWVSRPLRDMGHNLYLSVESGEKEAAPPVEAGDESGTKEVPF